jgi:hypothetical protein
MHPSASGYKRDLDDLYQLAGELFGALREEYSTTNAVSVRLDRIDSLLETSIGDEQLVATTLLCAQLLRRATAEPDQTQTRHVVTLGDIIDQTLTSLLHDGWPDTRVRRQLRDIHHRICTICMSLAVWTDPGATRPIDDSSI